MTGLDNYTVYIPFFALLIVAIFLFVGSVVAFKSKKRICSALLLLSSGIGLSAVLFNLYLLMILVGTMNTASIVYDKHAIEQFEKYVAYQEVSSYTFLFSYCFFAVSFVVYCCSISGIRQRNEQLEFIVSEVRNRY